MKTLIFLGVGVVVFVILPWLTPRFFKLYGNRPSELETKFLLFCLLEWGARRLGGQRGGAAGLSHRHGPGRNGRQGSRPGQAFANLDVRAAHAVLFSSVRARSCRYRR